MALITMTVLTLVTIERDTGPGIESLHQRIYDHPNVQQCYEVAGLFDLALAIAARTNGRLPPDHR
jgi:DNA-binding Lrp family transcriptional regulator